ncbi:helix-turn-helix domain-containing protein [Halalkalibacterium ligniniphilum]|uniref:helix-turn-helix domain-containing protein n=1 Tax=Halalkalibacterium ligniniphilum TaxID=1134413 RepID=UPI00035D70C5|nr:helix-turn-helix transcriptional regulator [Halalkalibacterium ligniniphilum]
MLSMRLKQARKRKNLTQQDLAERVLTKKTTISNYETGYSTPSNTMLVDLANALGVTTDYLLGRVDSPTEYKCEKDDINDGNRRELLHEVEKLNEADVKLLKLLVQRMLKE